MFNRVDPGKTKARYLSEENALLLRLYRRQAQLHDLSVQKIQSIPGRIRPGLMAGGMGFLVGVVDVARAA